MFEISVGDQYLCLDQVKEDGKIPPPPPPAQAASAAPAQASAVPPPVPPTAFVKVPAPPPGIQKESNSKIETNQDQKTSNNEISVTQGAEAESGKKGISPTMVRTLILANNMLFSSVFIFWMATLFTGLHMAKIGFISNMFG